MRFMSHILSATKQRLHPQSVAEISCHSVLLGDRMVGMDDSSLRQSYCPSHLSWSEGQRPLGSLA